MAIKLTHESRSAISRARFFLEKAKTCPVDARVDFEAFVEAAIVFARAAVHRLQSRHEKHAQWKEWWNGLRGFPSIEFFRTERDWILKEAAPKIGQKIFAASVGSTEPSHSPATAAELYYFDDPSIPATITVERHLDDLEKRLADAERLFIVRPSIEAEDMRESRQVQ
jgi:hypothetical protein